MLKEAMVKSAQGSCYQSIGPGQGPFSSKQSYVDRREFVKIILLYAPWCAGSRRKRVQELTMRDEPIST